MKMKSLDFDRGLSGNPYAYISNEALNVEPVALSMTGGAQPPQKATRAIPAVTINIDGLPSGNPYRALANPEHDEAMGPVVQGLLERSGKNFFYGDGRSAIEKSAREIHIEMWKSRKSLFGSSDISPLQIIDPKVAAKILGVGFEETTSIGLLETENGLVEIGGLLSRPNRQITISTRQLPQRARFTGAHEIGHWVLHPQMTELHRDLPIADDRIVVTNPLEWQANKFASAFLMPRKLVASEFIKRFGPCLPLRVSEDVEFGLNRKANGSLLNAKITDAEFACILATATYFAGEHFDSLASLFRVSEEAMTYRLLELNLVKRK